MSCDAWTFLNSQFLGTLVLVVTVIVLGIYARDTRRIARATVEQRNLTHRPCVVIANLKLREGIKVAMEQALEDNPQPAWKPFQDSPSMFVLPTAISLENVGMGPALSIEAYRLGPDRKRTSRLVIAHLKVGAVIGLDPTPSFKNSEEWIFEIAYQGVSGVKFFSRYTLAGNLVSDFAIRTDEAPIGRFMGRILGKLFR
jgi:hypothetical protein